MPRRRTVLKSIAGVGALSVGAVNVAAKQGSGTNRDPKFEEVVPAPVESKATPTDYAITADSMIAIWSEDARDVAEYLASILRPSTGYELPIVDGPPNGPAGGISLRLDGAITTYTLAQHDFKFSGSRAHHSRRVRE